MTNGKKIDLPTMSMTKSSAKNAAAEARAAAREHGDTDPLCIEQRRLRLSQQLLKMHEWREVTSAEKKATIAAFETGIAALQEQASTATDPLVIADLEQKTELMRQTRDAQAAQYNRLMKKEAVDCAMLEAQCIIIDSLTLRDEVESDSGKKGRVRYSAALIASEAEYFAGQTYRRMLKMSKFLAATNPEYAVLLAGDDEESESDDSKFSDADIVSDEDRSRIKKAGEE